MEGPNDPEIQVVASWLDQEDERFMKTPKNEKM